MMFEDIHEIAENSAYLKAIEEKDVSLEMLEQLPRYEDVLDLEQALKAEGKLDFDTIFHEDTGFYMFRCFLVADYAGDKALFTKDVETYQMMRFESARRKVSRLIFDRYVSDDPQIKKLQKNVSVFEIVKHKGGPDHINDETKMLPQHRQREDSFPSVDPTFRGENEDDEVNEEGGNAGSEDADDNTTGKHPLAVENGNHATEKPRERDLFQVGRTNPIGVYGEPVRRVKERIENNEAPNDLFDELLEEVLNDLQLDVFPRFLKSNFYKKYIRTKAIEHVPVYVKDFHTFRILGRGGFGTVHASRKTNCGKLYAMKCINKKLVKVKSALTNVMEERDVLTMVSSNFVTNLKYALQDEEYLYLIMDLMLGGDLKFHLINAGRFSPERAKFYAAEVLLGLEHIHKHNIIYRDMKLENVLLDHNGHVRISDLGLAVVTKSKIKGYAGTPGYTAPEMIKNKPYGPAVDIFSYGVMTYRMICGTKPFKGKIDRELDKAVVEKEPRFPRDIFSPEATSLLQGLLQKRPEKRLGCGPKGFQEIKEHPYFSNIDWGLLEAGYIDPPFTPNRFDVNAASLRDIGDFDTNKFRNVKLNERFKKTVRRFDFVSAKALQDEMVMVLQKADSDVNYEKFSVKPIPENAEKKKSSACCTIS